jgi:hypothetical protein
VALAGWVPARQMIALREMLVTRFHGRYWLDLHQPAPGEASEVPSLVRYPGWLKPFIPLVKSYGMPRYGEFDPALLFAFSYLLLFGAMFGDIGHGGIVLVVGCAVPAADAWPGCAWVGAAAGAVVGGCSASFTAACSVTRTLDRSRSGNRPCTTPIRMLASGGGGFGRRLHLRRPC